MPTPAPSSLATAIAAAKDLLRRAHDLQLRIAAVHERFGVTMLVSQALRDAQPAPSERPTAETLPQLNSAEVRELLQLFTDVQREMHALQPQVPALSDATWPNSPWAPEVASIEQEFERLHIDLMSLARSPAINSAYRAEMNAAHPALWSEETVERMMAAMAGVAGLMGINLDLRPPQHERPTLMSSNVIGASPLPFPADAEAIRRELRYNPERDGTPEQYVRMLAARIRTPEQFDAFLRAMVKYDTEFNRNGQQRLLNYQRIEQHQLWPNPAAFLTTYTADGHLMGDCKSVALAMRSILGLQGRDALIVETQSASAPDASGRIESTGHMAAIWIETVNGRLIAHRLDTTGRDGGSASLITVAGEPNESREQLIVRAFSEGPDHAQLPPEQLGLCHLRADGWAVDLPMTASLLSQSAAIERALDGNNWDAILAIVRDEITRTPQNLNLRLAEVQMLLLKRVTAAELEPAITAIEAMTRANPSTRTVPTNYYASRATVTAVRRAGHEDLALRLLETTR